MAELKEALLRRRADFENYKKRVERDREREQTAEAKAAAVLRRPAPAPSTTSSARFRRQAADDEPLREGVELTHAGADGAAGGERRERSRIRWGSRSTRRATRRSTHEALRACETGTVVEVFRKGYLLRTGCCGPRW